MDNPIEVIQVARDVFEVESFTKPGKFYTVNLNVGTCSCPRYTYGHYCKKHKMVAEAVRFARSMKHSSYTVEENLIEYCRRLLAPVEDEDLLTSFNLYLAVKHYRFATPRMVKEAEIRHRKAISMHDERSAAT